MKIIKGNNDELLVYGPCSWAKRDPVGDFVTPGFMVDFYNKWFNVVPAEYRNIMIDHDNYQIGVPELKYHSDIDGKTYYSYVHEVAPMLISRIRPDDGLLSTQQYRKKIVDGDYKSYSISWFPVKYETVRDNDDNPKDSDLWDTPYTNYHYEGDPIEVTICRYGMVDSAKFNVLKSRNYQSTLLKRLEALEERIGIGKPVPSPREDESEDDFISRCMSFLVGEEDYDQDQASAICHDRWRDKAAGDGEYGLPAECVCRECGYVMKDPGKHCTEIKCPECGAQMYRRGPPDKEQCNEVGSDHTELNTTIIRDINPSHHIKPELALLLSELRLSLKKGLENVRQERNT